MPLGRWEQLLSRKMRLTSPNLPKRILQNRRPWKPTDQTPWQRSRQLWLSHIICKLESRPATWAYDQPPSSKHHPRRSDSMACRPEGESHVCHGQTWTSACRIFSERRAIAYSRLWFTRARFLASDSACTRHPGRTNGRCPLHCIYRSVNLTRDSSLCARELTRPATGPTRLLLHIREVIY